MCRLLAELLYKMEMRIGSKSSLTVWAKRVTVIKKPQLRQILKGYRIQGSYWLSISYLAVSLMISIGISIFTLLANKPN